MFNFIKRLFSKNIKTEERKINSTAKPIEVILKYPNSSFAAMLKSCRGTNGFKKDYQLIDNFIKDHLTAESESLPLDFMLISEWCITPEIKKFAKLFKSRKLICINSSLNKFVDKVVSMN